MASRIKKNKTIMIVYGPGGHREQVKRLIEFIDEKNEIVEFTEYKVKPIKNNTKVIRCKSFETKYSISKFSLITSFFYQFFISMYYIIKIRPKKIISTGPIIGVVPIFIAYLFNRESVFIESWSRFYSKSVSGKICYKLANKFLVQNEELLQIYPKAIYVGRL